MTGELQYARRRHGMLHRATILHRPASTRRRHACPTLRLRDYHGVSSRRVARRCRRPVPSHTTSPQRCLRAPASPSRHRADPALTVAAASCVSRCHACPARSHPRFCIPSPSPACPIFTAPLRPPRAPVSVPARQSRPEIFSRNASRTAFKPR
ncbi:hypothetical protein B0H14DRAFT_419074 [Mycena olivaceomarginata]|nr:hypothetical protein B0H14DRAFT_419074 [Mycena olivaceomarginata]